MQCEEPRQWVACKKVYLSRVRSLGMLRWVDVRNGVYEWWHRTGAEQLTMTNGGHAKHQHFFVGRKGARHKVPAAGAVQDGADMGRGMGFSTGQTAG